jgi:hypothetical protein
METIEAGTAGSAARYLGVGLKRRLAMYESVSARRTAVVLSGAEPGA